MFAIEFMHSISKINKSKNIELFLLIKIKWNLRAFSVSSSTVSFNEKLKRLSFFILCLLLYDLCDCSSTCDYFNTKRPCSDLMVISTHACHIFDQKTQFVYLFFGTGFELGDSRSNKVVSDAQYNFVNFPNFF